MEEDLGDKRRIRKWSTPRPRFEEHQIPKTASGLWKEIYKRNGLWIRRSTTSERFFMFGFIDGEYEYLGELEQPDLWRLLIELGKSLQAFREELYTAHNFKRYKRYVFSLKKLNENARRAIE
jgi:hypothetical protein